MDCWDNDLQPPHPYIDIHSALKELVMLSDEVHRIAEGPWTCIFLKLGQYGAFWQGDSCTNMCTNGNYEIGWGLFSLSCSGALFQAGLSSSGEALWLWSYIYPNDSSRLFLQFGAGAIKFSSQVVNLDAGSFGRVHHPPCRQPNHSPICCQSGPHRETIDNRPSSSDLTGSSFCWLCWACGKPC